MPAHMDGISGPALRTRAWPDQEGKGSLCPGKASWRVIAHGLRVSRQLVGLKFVSLVSSVGGGSTEFQVSLPTQRFV